MVQGQSKTWDAETQKVILEAIKQAYKWNPNIVFIEDIDAMIEELT